MEKRVASVLLVLLAAGLSAAAVAGCSGDMGAIRLPSDAALGSKEMAVSMRGSGKVNNADERPWKCCDRAVPGPTTEGTVWYCMDKVEQCTCEGCFELEDGHAYYCLDGHKGSDPGPSCNHVSGPKTETAVVVRGSKKGNGEGRPWECCDMAVPGPTTQGIVWYCMDKVDECTCESCFELAGGHANYCLDGYTGSDPGPSCNRASGPKTETAIVVRGSRKGNDEGRPWECCDKAVPGPTTEGIVWYCMDKVDKCACESCFELEGGHAYYCLDGYKGSDPGPSCNHASGPKKEMAVVMRGSRKENGEGRPWECCDKAVPGPTTEGIVWYCMDKMNKCTCESCFELEGGHAYYCLDEYKGSDPRPTCNHA